MQPSDATPITVVEVVPPRSRETTVPDILIGSLSIVGLILVGAVIIGALCGGLLIAYKRLFPGNAFNGQSADESALHLSGPPQ
jgi:hypothetical protein